MKQPNCMWGENTQRIVLFGLSCLLSMPLLYGCAGQESGPPEPKEANASLKMVYVNSVEAAESPLRAKKVLLRIQGNLPSPAYEFQEFKVQLSGRSIDITPLAHYVEKKAVIQMLVPFDQVCTIDDMKPGNYEVKVHGKGGQGTLTTSIVVVK